MEISAGLAPGAREPLRDIFAALSLRDRELSAMRSHRWPRRVKAAERLGYLGNEEAATSLLDTLRDPVLNVRFAAARSLAARGEARSVIPVILAFDLPGAMNQRRVAETIMGFGPAALEPLLEILANNRGRYSNNALGVAARVLGLLRARPAVALLTALLDDPEFRVRLNAVRSLGLIGDYHAATAVARLADDREWEVRNVVMQALGQFGGTRHLEALTAGLRDESWWVRFSAAQALWQLGQPGREALTAAVARSPDRYARDMSRQILEEHGAFAAASHQSC
jgi:HEAT repeat protein